VIPALLAALQIAAGDTLQQVTLAQALQEATRFDPNYVAAVGRVSDAEWGRRAAMLVFILPSVTVTADFTGTSTESFNFGTNELSKTIVTAQLNASYGALHRRPEGRGAGPGRAEAEASAGQRGGRDFPGRGGDGGGILRGPGPAGAGRGRAPTIGARGGTAQHHPARACCRRRGQSDSLRVVLELTTAQVDVLREESALRVARLQLGRRIGRAGPVDAAQVDTTRARLTPDLPLTVEEAVAIALEQGPQYRVARANERAASAEVRARRAEYLPWATVSAFAAAYDDKFWPEAATRSGVNLRISLPIWNDGQREIALTRAKVTRDFARAVREDLERAALHDVLLSYDTYVTARAAADLARTAVVVAQENYRVQQTRYRSGATDILLFLDSQFILVEAEAGLVQALHTTQLARSGLEVILGRRLFPEEIP
jgi:outer membrane protein TolC